MKNETLKPTGGIQVIQRVAAIMNTLADAPEPMTLSNIVSETGLAPSTTHRFLNSLAELHLIKQNADGRWALGYRLLELGKQVYDRIDVRKKALPTMQALAAETGLTVNLGLQHNDRLLVVEQAAPLNDALPLPGIGASAPLHVTSGGKVILSRFSPEELRHYVERTGLPSNTDNSITSDETLFIALSHVREYGWAVDHQEFRDDIESVAAPIMLDDTIVGVLSVANCAGTLISHVQISALIKATQKLSTELL